MEKDKVIKHLDKAMDNRVPDVWDQIEFKINQLEAEEKIVRLTDFHKKAPTKSLYKRYATIAAVCLLSFTTLTFTPVMAAIEEWYDKIFSSKHIDDNGLKIAMNQGLGQSINQTYYDEKLDISVHFQSVLTDDKETKLLVTYESDKTNLKNYSIDNFEGYSSIYLQDENDRKKLGVIGWGSRYYDEKENKVAEALSFDSIKDYANKSVTLEIENLTIDEKEGNRKAETIWPLTFTLQPSAISDRETIVVNKSFTFKQQTYQIKQVEFSAFETRVVITGTDTKIQTDEVTGEQYRMTSQLENQFLNSKKFDKKYGYIVAPGKSGVFLRSAGEQVEPIFNKGEVEGEKDEYLMIFAPVKDRNDTVLEVGEEIKIPLN
jgi:hypothetical protein